MCAHAHEYVHVCSVGMSQFLVCSLYFYVSVPDEKLVFELELALVSSQPWVTAPKHLCMWSGGKVPLQALDTDECMIYLQVVSSPLKSIPVHWIVEYTMLKYVCMSHVSRTKTS